MRQLQLVLLSAILVVLCVIAYQLTRLAADFQLGSDIRASVLSSVPPNPPATETTAQRIDRKAREGIAARDKTEAVLREYKAIDAREKQLRAERARASR